MLTKFLFMIDEPEIRSIISNPNNIILTNLCVNACPFIKWVSKYLLNYLILIFPKIKEFLVLSPFKKIKC